MSIVFWLVISIPFLFVIAPYIYRNYKEFKILLYKSRLKGSMPHKLVDNLIQWEDGDQILLKEHKLYEDPSTWTLYYRGVTDQKEFVFSKRSYKGSNLRKMDIGEFLGRYEYENTDLKSRQESEKNIKEELENSQYNKFLKQTKKELEKIEKEWKNRSHRKDEDVLEFEKNNQLENSNANQKTKVKS